MPQFCTTGRKVGYRVFGVKSLIDDVQQQIESGLIDGDVSESQGA